ncbi:MAG: VOC family protein [Hyphomicrobiales bacterium]|nr:VOC family protein [Hyphomicrobiales bacterium]
MTTKRKTKITPAPKGYHTATPVLVVQNAAAAIDYYVAAFGAKELSRSYAADNSTILLATLKIGNSIVHLNDELPSFGILSPTSLGGSANAVHLYLAKIDEVWQNTIEAGATVVMPLEDTFWGERRGKIIDPFGHVWVLSIQTEILNSEEIKRRSDAFYGTSEVTPLPTQEENLVAVEDLPVIDIEQGLIATANSEVVISS